MPLELIRTIIFVEKLTFVTVVSCSFSSLFFGFLQAFFRVRMTMTTDWRMTETIRNSISTVATPAKASFSMSHSSSAREGAAVDPVDCVGIVVGAIVVDVEGIGDGGVYV